MLRVYQTMGLAFIFIPTNVLSYVNIRRENNNQVSSMVNFVRNIGGSVGIALSEHLYHADDADQAELFVREHARRKSEFPGRWSTASAPRFAAMV